MKKAGTGIFKSPCTPYKPCSVLHKINSS